jgi:hypothetical protein
MNENAFVRFEYDMAYSGGDYSGVGNFALVPLALCYKLGSEAAFQQHTGIDPVHIIHYTLDELYDSEGDLLTEGGFKVWIDWEGPGLKEEVPCYEFETQAELDAFLEGVTAASCAWDIQDYRIYRSQEEFDAGEFRKA